MTEFKYIPKYGTNIAKQTNIVNFLQSLNVKKSNDRKIENYNDFFLFQHLYTSSSEIIRNEEILSNKNIKSRVHTLITTSKASDNLAFIAANIDGVIDSLRTNVMSFGNDSNFENMDKATITWKKTNKEVETLVKKLKEIIENNLKDGYGNRYQLKRYESKKLDENKDEILKLFFNENKTAEDISEKLTIKKNVLDEHINKLIDANLLKNKDTIIKRIESGDKRIDIASDYKASKNKLNKFFSANKITINAR